MHIPILVEPVEGNGYCARGGEPLSLTAEGATPEEAVQRLRLLVQARLRAGARLVSLELPDGDHPWRPVAGMYKDDPLFDDWQRAITEYRQQVEEDHEIP